MEITYDPRKNERNIELRGLSFSLAAEFDFESALYLPQEPRADGEDRIMAIGILGVHLHSLIFTMRGTVLRVISLRRASRKERKLYAQAQA